MDLSELLNHFGEDRAAYYGAVVPPIVQTSMFAFKDVAAFRACLKDELNNPFYTRGHNPTTAILRQKLAALEGAEDCLVFGSGSAAIAAAVMASVSAGDHVVCVQKPYSWTRQLLGTLLARFAVRTSFVDARELGHVENAIDPATKMIVVESPNSMTFELQDLAAIATLARARGIRTLCDNSCASPLHQSPIALGIDFSAHSGTKYLNGHSDVVAGVLCGSHTHIREVFQGPFMTIGAILPPFESWLMLRGLRTFDLRMQRVAESTQRVLDFLRAHPKVARLYHSHIGPQRALAERQMRGISGLLSIEVATDDFAGVERFCNALKRFLLACSWGGYESLAFPICGLFSSENYAASEQVLPFNLVRLSIGLEDPALLIDDLAQALAMV
jgi:cystathionine beta-lyase/cystathionine gamma-synthase